MSPETPSFPDKQAPIKEIPVEWFKSISGNRDDQEFKILTGWIVMYRLHTPSPSERK